MISLEALGNILTAINVFVDLLACVVVYDALLERKLFQRNFRLLLVATYLVLYGLVNFSPWFHGTSLPKYAFILTMIYLLALIAYKGHPIKKFFCAIGYQIINYVIGYMSVIFLMILSKKSQQELYGSPAGYLVVMFFNMLMIFTIIVICKKLLKGRAKDKTIRLTTVEWMGFLLMPLCSIVTLILLVDYSMKSNEVSLWLLADCMFLLAANIGQVILQDKMEQERQAATEAKILAQNAQSAMGAAVAINNAYTQQRALVHDFRNQLQTVQELLCGGRTEEARAYVQSLASAVSVSVIVVSTNNPFVDAVLNQKYHAAKRAGVTMMFQINNLADLPIEDKDIVTILANVLDNAIEAASQVKEGERFISVKFEKREEETLLSVRNTMRGTAHIVNNTVATTKDHSEEHGYDLPNVRRTLEKYGLDYVVCSTEGWFQFTTLLS